MYVYFVSVHLFVFSVFRIVAGQPGDNPGPYPIGYRIKEPKENNYRQLQLTYKKVLKFTITIGTIAYILLSFIGFVFMSGV